MILSFTVVTQMLPLRVSGPTHYKHSHKDCGVSLLIATFKLTSLMQQWHGLRESNPSYFREREVS